MAMTDDREADRIACLVADLNELTFEERGAAIAALRHAVRTVCRRPNRKLPRRCYRQTRSWEAKADGREARNDEDPGIYTRQPLLTYLR
jgi:hypothetical protein